MINIVLREAFYLAGLLFVLTGCTTIGVGNGNTIDSASTSSYAPIDNTTATSIHDEEGAVLEDVNDITPMNTTME